ncbi:hypothetical protein [Prosthecobacter sp.]|jgi:hypothetical protein|uniref:hypothetical protein n=1 Tax=Prosthecobacter sp. TaxID=1965333 RepID=UPI0037C7C470
MREHADTPLRIIPLAEKSRRQFFHMGCLKANGLPYFSPGMPSDSECFPGYARRTQESKPSAAQNPTPTSSVGNTPRRTNPDLWPPTITFMQ